MPQLGSVTISGEPIIQYMASYETGWHLVGSPFEELQFNNPTDSPDNSVIAAFCWNSFGKKYNVVFPDGVGELQPGAGYWIAVVQPCEIGPGRTICE